MIIGFNYLTRTQLIEYKNIFGDSDLRRMQYRFSTTSIFAIGKFLHVSEIWDNDFGRHSMLPVRKIYVDLCNPLLHGGYPPFALQ